MKCIWSFPIFISKTSGNFKWSQTFHVPGFV